uniref:Cdc23 domain-containing protein n=2 Tax=Phaeomonas parva TaxID=124430 RepID=A0A7S1UFA8_9STRA|mmetsp:Transcript_45334/g.142119  ORF Transcript_45334/g.142119 Transcript_45334/m.142119 type:complete len:406 (+) Transcript_45334:819-2036(+)
MAVTLDPMLWGAVEALCQLGGAGADLRAGAILSGRPGTSAESAESPPQGGDDAGADAQEEDAAPGLPRRAATSMDAPMRAFAQLLHVLGAALQHNCRYEGDEAIAGLANLPPRHRQTGWVQYQLGRAYFEKGDYEAAVEALRQMQRVAPHRIAGLELLSTAYWHLKKEVELCYLAQRAKHMDRGRPEVWCVVGNCFSLQKEHETAIRFFKRALQVDEGFTYAYSLCGHEYVANEDFDRALACYRHAIRTDERHYNGWYGIGAIYYRQEKLELAEFHFRRAIALHPRSSVLYCYLGMVLQSREQHGEALEMLDRAIALGRNNPQARFQRANVLIQVERLAEAVEELRVVCDAAPKEPSVHTLLGKVLKRLGHAEEARRFFTTALDLDPKDTNYLKNAMESDEDEAF